MPVQKSPPTQLVHVDAPEVRETFIDSVSLVVWDGQTLRVDLSVTRYPDLAGGAAQATRRPAARLVLTPQAAADLANRLQQTMGALMKNGVLSAQTPPPGGTA